MAKPLLPDELWELIEPLIPKRPPRPKGGRPPIDDRKVLTGIIFVLKTGIPWEYLPQEMGCGCGMTCWRRLKSWFHAGVWDKIHTAFLGHLRWHKKIDFSRFLIDTSHVRAVGGGAQTGPSPVDRRKLGSKISVLTDARGVPVVVRVIPANRNDTQETIPMIDWVPPIAGLPGRPRRRPERLQGDRGFYYDGDRRELRRRKIIPVIGKRRTPHGSGLGKLRWFIERTISWLRQFRRIRVRYDRTPAMYYSFLKLAAALICYRIFVSGFS
jgi:transposase